MPVDPKTLSQYHKKDVILVALDDEGNAHEYEGYCQGASAAGLAFKEKGKRDTVLVEPSKIEDIREAPSKPRKMIQKKMKPITEGNVRQHLVDRHGLSLKEGNELTEEEAAKAHSALDHSGLGHRHVAEKQNAEGSEEKSAA